MRQWLSLVDPSWSFGSYVRKNYKDDVIYKLFQYKGFTLVYNRADKSVYITDGVAEQLLKDRLISMQAKECYDAQMTESLTPFDAFDDLSVEAIYGKILALRRSFLGVECLEQGQKLLAKRGCLFDTDGGIDQSDKKKEMLGFSKAVIFVLCQVEFAELMRRDVRMAREMGKEIYLVVDKERGGDIPTKEMLKSCLDICDHTHFLEMEEESLRCNLERIAWNEALQMDIENGAASLMVYGEDGLLHCKNLQIDAVVHAIPAGYHARAVTNQLECTRACIVYVPKHFDITRWVPITQRSRLTYWHLSKLWERYGDMIYSYTPEQLYCHYPQYFLNMYENGRSCTAAEKDFPIQIHWQEGCNTELTDMRLYDGLREDAIKGFLNKDENVSYYSAYFDEQLREQPIPWESTSKQSGILVNGIKIKKAATARVINSREGQSIRQLLRENGQHKEISRFRMVSNFLFFLTPSLARLYNELRKGCKREQISVSKQHLDYMLCYQDGKRIETFPLFRKACIGKKRDGQFLFFNFRLGAGRICVNGYSICWKDTDVDVEVAGDGCRQSDNVRLYTPYYSVADGDADRNTYCKPVGEGRINLVIVQDKLICVRRGCVLLPGIGVVVSLEESMGEAFLRTTGLRYLEDGYYDSDTELSIELEGPSEIAAEEWEQMEWAYGGGLSLILDGESVCDKEDMSQWFTEEGWMSPLSRQTQESSIHTLVKHPRTAIGITWTGELVVLVFSGRTWISTGADYMEMCRIARELIPDIRSLMNVDGGASAVLGVELGDSFIELSYPSTSIDSCAGMIRPIHTILYL